MWFFDLVNLYYHTLHLSLSLEMHLSCIAFIPGANDVLLYIYKNKLRHSEGQNYYHTLVFCCCLLSASVLGDVLEFSLCEITSCLYLLTYTKLHISRYVFVIFILN